MLTPINQIAAAIEVAFYDLRRMDVRPGDKPPPPEPWIDAALSALEPLHSVRNGEDFYGIDKATVVIDGFLEAAKPWTGALATHLKRQLRNHLHENHQS